MAREARPIDWVGGWSLMFAGFIAAILGLRGGPLNRWVALGIAVWFGVVGMLWLVYATRGTD